MAMKSAAEDVAVIAADPIAVALTAAAADPAVAVVPSLAQRTLALVLPEDPIHSRVALADQIHAQRIHARAVLIHVLTDRTVRQ